MKHRASSAALLTGAAFLLLWVMPYLVLGEDAHIVPQDNLDSEIIFNRLGAKYFFDFSGVIPEFINLDVRALNVFSTFQLVFYAFLPPFWAYIANEFVVRLIAYAGMYLLLSLIFSRCFRTEGALERRQAQPGNPYVFVTLAISVVFAWLPLYSVYGLTSVGMPMLAWALYTVFLRGSAGKAEVPAWKLRLCFLYIAFFGLSSALILSGYFILFALFGMCAYFLCKQQHRKKQIWFYLAAALLLAIYILCNLKLISLMLSGYQSHRTLWESAESKNFVETILWFFALFGLGRPHAGGYYSVIVLLCVIVFVWGWRGDKKNRIWQWLSWIILLNAAIAAANALLSSALAGRIMTALGLGGFRASRLFFALPFAWHTAGAFALAYIWEKIAGSKSARARIQLARGAAAGACVASFIFASAAA